MRIGYACLTKGVRNASFKTCRIKNASEENLLNIIEHNLNVLENIIDYNVQNNIKLFRITSDLIPFGSNEVNKIEWWNDFKPTFDLIGEKIKSNNMRVTMHPGQYTVLNSTSGNVVEKAIDDLDYHRRVLDSLSLELDSKIVLHIGGVYGDKPKAIERFIENFESMDDNIKSRIVIENDDKSFNIEDVLNISRNTSIPVIFDNLHNEVVPSDYKKDHTYWIEECRKTWSKKDGIQKIHYSQQDLKKKKGAHSSTIDVEKFIEFVKSLDDEVDIMLEVKDKNLSAVKCINAITVDRDIKRLELEWSKYKYLILEKNHKTYNEIRTLLKDKSGYPVLELYSLIDGALEKDQSKRDITNAALHVWGYFKKIASEKEKDKFMKYLNGYQEDYNSVNKFKKILWELTEKYNSEYLLNSYYFMDIVN